jgi:hypothetical protein
MWRSACSEAIIFEASGRRGTWVKLLSAPLFQVSPENGPGWRSSSHLFEAGPAKCRRQPGEHERVRLLALRVDRIPFEYRCPTFPCEFRRRLKQLNRNAPSAVLARNKEASDRPDGLVIYWLENTRAGEPHVMLTRCDGTPTHGLTIGIGDQTRRFACLDQRTHALSIGFTFLRVPFRRWQSPPHAPATGARAVPAEELLEIRPPRWCERINREFQLRRHSLRGLERQTRIRDRIVRAARGFGLGDEEKDLDKPIVRRAIRV